MATDKTTLSRRQALAGIGLVSAAAVVPIAGMAKASNVATGQHLPLVDRRAWDAALATYQRIDAAYSEAVERHTVADNAAEADCPRIARFFDEYRLRMGLKRDRVLEELRWQDRPDADAIADEFMAYQQRCKVADARYGVDELNAEIDELRDPFFDARENLMELPAPDTKALLVKMEIAAVSLCEDHAEGTFADARRLLGQEG